MISKCHMSEIESKIAEYLIEAESNIELQMASQYWIGRIGDLYDAIWTLYLVRAISERTFLDSTQPIVDFEHKYDMQIICKYNKPVYGF